MLKPVILYDDTRPGKKAKYYSVTRGEKHYAYSHKEDLDNWLQIMELAGNTSLSGKLEDWENEFQESYEIKELHIEAGNRVPNKQY